MVGIQLKQAIKNVANGIFVVHQNAKNRRIFGQQEFFALFIPDNVLFSRLVGVVIHEFSFFKILHPSLLVNTLFSANSTSAFCKITVKFDFIKKCFSKVSFLNTRISYVRRAAHRPIVCVSFQYTAPQNHP